MTPTTKMNHLQTECHALVIGAGLSGLSAAYHLELIEGGDYLVLERNQEIGGLARTETYKGFSFDHSIHILYTRDAYAADLICNKLLAANLSKQERESYCYTSGVYTEYPYQVNSYGLPAEVIAENILGLIEAYYELPQEVPPSDFEAWIYRTFGRGIAEHFMLPYNRRQWAWDLKAMNYDWIAERVPMPKIEDVLLGALKPPERKYGPNREFWYPIEGGIESLPQGFLRYLPEERVLLNVRVVAIDASRHKVILSDGRSIRYEWLISTMSLPLLINMLGENIPKEVVAAAASLKHNIVHTINIGLDGTSLGLERPMHWIYFPDEGTIFHRISFPHHFSEWMVPLGCCSIQAEISESAYRSIDESVLVQETLDGLVRVGILSENEILPSSRGGRVLFTKTMSLNPAYIIYDLAHSMNTRIIKSYLRSLNIETRGRFGEWEYFNMDNAILSGKAAVEEIVKNDSHA